MKVVHLDRCKEALDHFGVSDLASPEAYSIMVDYAYSHRTGVAPDEFVSAMRRWFCVKSSPGKG